jgi:hypothetical protein
MLRASLSPPSRDEDATRLVEQCDADASPIGQGIWVHDYAGTDWATLTVTLPLSGLSSGRVARSPCGGSVFPYSRLRKMAQLGCGAPLMTRNCQMRLPWYSSLRGFSDEAHARAKVGGLRFAAENALKTEI